MVGQCAGAIGINGLEYTATTDKRRVCAQCLAGEKGRHCQILTIYLLIWWASVSQETAMCNT